DPLLERVDPVGRDPERLLDASGLDDHGSGRHRRRLLTVRRVPASMERTAHRVREHPAVVLAAGAMLVSGALLLHWLGRLTFWGDEWNFLLHRRGWGVGTFLDPAVEHLSTLPIFLYKVQLATFGMSSPRSYQVVAVLGFLTSMALLFAYVRSRAGE